ncbi:LCP family protein [Candidatus Parcubacteria bacterium]|nr:LCP family protein [Candidatus Parcubacteria bacterium]
MLNKRKEQPRKYGLHRTLASGVSASSQGLAIPHASPDISQKNRRLTKKKLVLLIFSVILIPLLTIGIWDYRNFASASSKIFGTSNPLGVFAGKPLDDQDKRVNILLVGYSADNPGHGGALLTDSIMILSLDKDSKTGYMLSIPRDLYVNIPGYGNAKINEAYQAGERADFSASGYPNGGIGLLQKVLSDNLNIETQYYFLINYSAVRDTVDALDGIEVSIESSDKRGIYDPNFQPHEGGPLKLPNGKHQIDGQTALRLTRARGSTSGSYGFPQSDFNRTQNQQAVFAAIKKQLNWTLVLDPRTNGQIFDAAAENLQTDLDISEVLPFYRLMAAIPEEKLQPVSLGDLKSVNLLRGFRTPTGQAALVPAAGIQDFSQIQNAIRSLNQ